ncbi:hypothetical protein VNO78_14754 [Psophocarpus tetragonolobus]|uniref:Uncharacterized protein n=1 Tax=Psophocarpus tetragonolobus TaxID=3891 RepID=A0AAN9SIF4_PSOTE
MTTMYSSSPNTTSFPISHSYLFFLFSFPRYTSVSSLRLLENLETSTVQSTPAVESGSAPLTTYYTEGLQKKNQLTPESSLWTGHIDADKNLVTSFSDDDSGSDFETKSNAPSLPKEVPEETSLNSTFVSSMTKISGPNSKGAGSMQLVQGSKSQPRNLNLIAVRESELKLKAAQQNKESASVLGRDHSAMNPKKTDRKTTPVFSGPAQLESKEPDRKKRLEKLRMAHAFGL